MTTWNWDNWENGCKGIVTRFTLKALPQSMIWVRVWLPREGKVINCSAGRYRDLSSVFGTPGDNRHPEVHGNQYRPKSQHYIILYLLPAAGMFSSHFRCYALKINVSPRQLGRNFTDALLRCSQPSRWPLWRLPGNSQCNVGYPRTDIVRFY